MQCLFSTTRKLIHVMKKKKRRRKRRRKRGKPDSFSMKKLLLFLGGRSLMHIKDKNHMSSSTSHNPPPKTDKCFNYPCLLALPTARGREKRRDRQTQEEADNPATSLTFLFGSILFCDGTFSRKGKNNNKKLA